MIFNIYEKVSVKVKEKSIEKVLLHMINMH